MGRRPESLIKRIARHTGHTEDSLQAFLDEKHQSCLLWRGALKPKTPRPDRWVHRATIGMHNGHGLEHSSLSYPRPWMTGGRPRRLLFMHHHKLDALDDRIQIRSDCKQTLCISPFHARMATSQGYRGRPDLPMIGDIVAESELQFLIDAIKADPEPPTTLEALYMNWPVPHEQINEAYRRLGWQLPQS